MACYDVPYNNFLCLPAPGRGGVISCSDPNLKGDCCLSERNTNCPDGWGLSDNKYSPNSCMDPFTMETRYKCTRLKPLLDYPACTM